MYISQQAEMQERHNDELRPLARCDKTEPFEQKKGVDRNDLSFVHGIRGLLSLRIPTLLQTFIVQLSKHDRSESAVFLGGMSAFLVFVPSELLRYVHSINIALAHLLKEHRIMNHLNSRFC